MARVEATFFTVGNRSEEGGSMPVARGTGMVTEARTVGATPVEFATTAQGNDKAFVRILSDVDVWVVTGAAPLAEVPPNGASRPGWRAIGGVPCDLALEQGDRVVAVEV